MATYDAVSSLPLSVDGYSLEALSEDVSSGFTRRTTVVQLHGGGHEGVGEDVTYGGDEQLALQAAGAVHDLAGDHTIASFSELVGSLDLFPGAPPKTDAWRLYRQWAFESAALDLALRQAGTSFADAVGREPRAGAVRRLEAASRATVGGRAAEAARPLSGHAIQARPDGRLERRDRCRARRARRCRRCRPEGGLQGHRRRRRRPTLRSTAASREAFPDATIEDPDLDDAEAAAVLEPHRDRISWDAVIHSVSDIESLPFPPSTLNIKPSRFGSLQALLAAYDYCDAKGIVLYGGGQFELGPGRGQIQYLASLFHPHGPNDVAPGGYNEPEPGPGLQTSPLVPPPLEAGFRWS